MAPGQPTGLNLSDGGSILEQAEAALERQEADSLKAGAVVTPDGKVGVEGGIKKGLGRDWSLGAWARWWKGDKRPSVGAEVTKRW